MRRRQPPCCTPSRPCRTAPHLFFGAFRPLTMLAATLSSASAGLQRGGERPVGSAARPGVVPMPASWSPSSAAWCWQALQAGYGVCRLPGIVQCCPPRSTAAAAAAAAAVCGGASCPAAWRTAHRMHTASRPSSAARKRGGRRIPHGTGGASAGVCGAVSGLKHNILSGERHPTPEDGLQARQEHEEACVSCSLTCSAPGGSKCWSHTPEPVTAVNAQGGGSSGGVAAPCVLRAHRVRGARGRCPESGGGACRRAEQRGGPEWPQHAQRRARPTADTAFQSKPCPRGTFSACKQARVEAARSCPTTHSSPESNAAAGA